MSAKEYAHGAQHTFMNGCHNMDSYMDYLRLFDNPPQCCSSSSGLHSTALATIGYFWDLENCRYPQAQKSAVDVAHTLRAQFERCGREVRFDVVCDVTKVCPDVMRGHNLARLGESRCCERAERCTNRCHTCFGDGQERSR
jgi:hypothetical protein